MAIVHLRCVAAFAPLILRRRSSAPRPTRILVDETGCRVIVADDGIGLPDATEWPKPGKLAALIVQSLRQNAGARVDVDSAPGTGVKVTILFARANATPDTQGPAAPK